MNRFIYIFSLLLTAVNLPAQPDSCKSSLSGRIIDEHDKTALEFASIHLVEINRTTLSDEKGNYAFLNICDGIYTVKVSHVGCDPIVKTITVKGNTKKNFYPEHHAEELKQIDIITPKLKEKPTQKLDSLSRRKMEETKGKSLGDALKNITGVGTLKTGSSISKPIIHGMHSSRILILNNGVRQEGQQWGNEHAPEIDPFIAGNLSVVKGASSVRYGSGAMAGVILVDPKPLRDSAGMGGELNLVGFSNGKQGTVSGLVDGNFRKKLAPLSWRLQGTYKQGGNIRAPDYFLKNTGIKEYNFSYALQWREEKYGVDIFYSQFNTTLGIFSASHIGNLTDLELAFTSPVPLEMADFTYKIDRPYQHIEHELFKSGFHIKTGNTGKLFFIYARQYDLRYEYDKHKPRNDSLAALNLPELLFEITTHTGDIIWEHSRIKSFVGSVGLSGMMQANTYEGRFFIPNFRNYSGGAFWIERLKKNKYELELGVRYDYKWMQIFMYEKSGPNYVLISPVRNYQNLSATSGFIFKPDSVWNITLNFGNSWRPPGVNELYSNGLHHGAAAIENGDTSLIPETAFNTVLSVRYTPSKKLATEVSVYYNYINDFIYLRPLLTPALTIQGAFPTFSYDQTDASLRGIDAAFFYKPVSSFELSFKASLLRARDLSAGDWLVMMPSDRYETEFTYKFKDRKYFSETYISLGGQYITRQWRVPSSGDYAPPPGEYFLLNLESSATLHLKRQSLVIGFGIENILNTSYRDYLDRFRYYTDAMGRNFIVRIKVPFNLSFKQTNPDTENKN